MHRPIHLSVLLLCVLDFALAGAPHAAAPADLSAANNRRSVEEVLAGYTEDAIWLPPDRPILLNRSSFRPRYEALYRDNQIAYSAEVSEARADGDVGYAWGRIRGTITPNDGSAPTAVDDTFLAITRCERGRWLVSHLMWSHRPPSQ